MLVVFFACLVNLARTFHFRSGGLSNKLSLRSGFALYREPVVRTSGSGFAFYREFGG